MESEKIGALPSGDIDDLDVFAFEHLERLRARDVDGDVETRLRERLGHAVFAGRQRLRPADEYQHVGGRCGGRLNRSKGRSQFVTERADLCDEIFLGLPLVLQSFIASQRCWFFLNKCFKAFDVVCSDR